MRVTIEVNGADRTLRVEPRTTLLDALREGWHLTGTVGGCGEGVCGACTVLVDGEPVRSCLTFAVQANDKAVVTVEGLETDGALHPLQRAFANEGAFQCGYCTAGFMMLAAGALHRDLAMSRQDVEALVSANVCRCLGYEPIVRAILLAQDEMQADAQ